MKQYRRIPLLAAILAVAFSASICAAAVVEVATNGVTLGGTTDSVTQPQGNVSGQVFGPTYFLNHVYLEDDTETPLHLRLPVGTNSTEAIVQAVLEQIANPFTEAYETNGAWQIDGKASFTEDAVFTDIETSVITAGNAITLGTNTITSWSDISFDPVPVFTNGTAPGLVLAPMSYSTYLSRFAGSVGVFYVGDYLPPSLFFQAGTSPSDDGYFMLTSSSMNIACNVFADKDIKAASFTLGTNTITEWPTGGGGLSGSRVITANSSVADDDYLIWLDTRAFSSSSSVTLTLPDMAADSQTIVVRRLGNDGAATIARGTNTWTLAYDGDGVTVDWVGAATNWYWRSF